jgi:molecular chaperone Hsp33
LTPQDIVTTTLPNVRILSTRPVRFACTCSKERLGRILVSLGPVELEDMIATGGAELVCHWCESRYEFDREQLQQLYEAARKKGSV